MDDDKGKKKPRQFTKRTNEIHPSHMFNTYAQCVMKPI